LISFGCPAGVIPLVLKVIYEAFNPIHTLRILISSAKVAVFSDKSKRLVKNLRTFNLLRGGASVHRQHVP
jgi:hypothetical protein